jgi:N4-bis(aminopropyl)spermidine synthase
MAETSLLETVARATRLREGPAGVSAVLRAVYRAGSLRLQDAARQARLPLPVATAVRRELEKAGLLERKHGLALTREGRDFVERDLGLGMALDLVCPTCAGRGIAVPREFQPLIGRLAAIAAQAPSADVTLDQAPCTPETALLRALLMLQAGALEGRRVLVLGDDDCVSLAIGLLGRSLGRTLTRALVVVDADERWLAFLRAAAAAEQIALETVRHDLRRPLPDALKRSFDTVETDPPYTLAGARLFLARAGEALNADGLCFFSFARWPPAQMLELQQLFVERGLAVRAVRPDFNRYAGASILGNVSQLIELVQVEPPAAEPAAWTGPLYTAEINPRLRAYVCAACGAETVLGEDGAPATIEALKASGCGACGGRVFRRRAG